MVRRNYRLVTTLSSLGILLLVIASPFSHVSAQSSNLPVISLTVTNASGASNAGNGYEAILWRYPTTSSGPTDVASAVINSSGTVNLYDQGLTSFSHPNSYVHYSILVLQRQANGSLLQVTNYHWTSEITGSSNGVGGEIVATQELVLTINDGRVAIVSNGQIVPYVVVSSSSAETAGLNATHITTQSTGTSNSAWPMAILTATSSPNGGSSLNSIQPDTVADCFYIGMYEYCWSIVESWTNQWTTIGEATGSGDMSDTFSYGVSSGSTLGVAVSTGGSWSISGSYTITNQQSSATTWPVLHCCANYLANSQFNYDDGQLCDYVLVSCIAYYDSYQIWATGWDGSDQAWLDAGQSTSSPGDCLSLTTIQDDGYSYGEYAANSNHSVTMDSDYTYGVALTIGSPTGGTGNAQISDTTAYSSHTTQAISFSYEHSYYYLYSNEGGNKYPVLFSSNSDDGCDS